jgi:hypothetical protein
MERETDSHQTPSEDDASEEYTRGEAFQQGVRQRPAGTGQPEPEIWNLARCSGKGAGVEA